MNIAKKQYTSQLDVLDQRGISSTSNLLYSFLLSGFLAGKRACITHGHAIYSNSVYCIAQIEDTCIWFFKVRCVLIVGFPEQHKLSISNASLQFLPKQNFWEPLGIFSVNHLLSSCLMHALFSSFLQKIIFI